MKELLRLQLAGSFNLLTEVVDSATDEEWVARPYPGANLIGWSVWHGARTIDWAINHVLRDRSELADDPAWNAVNVDEGLFGACIPRDAADRAAHDVSRSLLKDYLAALRADTLEWFDALREDTLDVPTDLERGRTAKPEYHRGELWQEILDLNGLPTWQFLSRPCVSHIRVHYGDVMGQLEAIRARGTHPTS